MIEIWAIGGYSEIGKNMTGVRYNDEAVILDMGVWLDRIIGYDGDAWKLSHRKLMRMGALPDDKEFHKKFNKQVKAIICTHSHLDHIGAIPKTSKGYSDAPIIGTPFTIEVIKNNSEDGRIPNKLIKLNPGSSYKVSENITVEFIYATHSTLQVVMVAIHTPDGTVMYANDWKFDEYPSFGKRTDYKRIKKLGKSGKVVALISDSTRIEYMGRTFSESIVKNMLKDVLYWMENDDKLIIATTFASHCARVKTILEMAEKMGRTPIVLGRSMRNYMNASTKAGLIDFSKYQKYSYRNELKEIFRTINKEGREKFLLVTTGNQGEPNSVLVRMAQDELDLKLDKGDHVVFCSTVIPNPMCEANRSYLEKNLKEKGVRIFKDIHVSGHASREDHRDLISMVMPKHYIPTHGTIQKLASAAELGIELGYNLGETVHLLEDGQKVKIE